MNIVISSKHNVVTNSEISFFCKWVLAKFLTERQLAKVQLRLLFRPNLVDDDHDSVDAKILQRAKYKYTITIEQNIKRSRALFESLAHELVHLKDYVSGQLKSQQRGDYWQGKRISKKTDYYDTPWEIEAFGRSHGLYVRYTQYKKRNRLEFKCRKNKRSQQNKS